MRRAVFLTFMAAAPPLVSCTISRVNHEPKEGPARRPPNIVVILADGLGYGDVEDSNFVEPPSFYCDGPPYTGCLGMITHGWQHKDADTLLIVTSDSGALTRDCVWLGDHVQYRTCGHASCGDWRAFKSHIWEGGHREAFLARWPGPGSRRNSLVHHSGYGVFTMRQDQWTCIFDTKGSGGWPPPVGQAPAPNTTGQLYDLNEDPCESCNRWDDRPDMVKYFREMLERCHNA